MFVATEPREGSNGSELCGTENKFSFCEPCDKVQRKNPVTIEEWCSRVGSHTWTQKGTLGERRPGSKHTFYVFLVWNIALSWFLVPPRYIVANICWLAANKCKGVQLAKARG